MVDETQKFTKKEFNQIKFFILFGVFIIVFQFLQYITAKQASEKYKILFNKTAEIQSCINSMHIESTSIQRFNLNLALSDDDSEKEKIGKKIKISEKKIDSLIGLIESKIVNLSIDNKKPIEVFFNEKSNWINYKKKYIEFSKIIFSHDKTQITFYRTTILRNNFDVFQQGLNSFFMEILDNQNFLTHKISKSTEKSSFYLLISGNSILFILICFLIYIIFSERKNLREE